MTDSVRPDLRVLFAALLVALAGLVLLPSAQARAVTGHQVTMSGYAFQPAALTISAGDTVTWTNHDTAPHDVEITQGPASAHSPLLDKGQSWSFTFTTAGSYTYVCTVHPGMAARLAVKAAPTQAPRTQAPRTQAPLPPPVRASSHTGHDMAGGTAPRTAGPTSRASAARAGQARRNTRPASSTASVPQIASGVAPTTQPAQAADPARPLQPLLVLAGLIAGVSVVCLLLVGSRSATGSREATPKP